ncbi:OmpA family protein [Paraburkholderia sp. BL10I2N1]|uniref:OmpA family protein n=1 Tax=Paraburkholderia sp. BL10I2N1 TaxID=1938796 RepID=UPI001060FC0E|nr:OmpA family protein [Paraburkholderia sp. BL10I2N1]TDN62919.1 OmpA family protein [Paraburkholderia sp. BL10I2N1]
MRYSLIAIALAAVVAGCSSTVTRDRLQIQDPTVLQNGFGATQDRLAGAATPEWIATYGGAQNGAMLNDVQKRLNALGTRKDNYFGQKAQCWLDAARDERRRHDGWGFVEEALREANRMTSALETGNGFQVDNPDLRTAATVRPDLWKQILAAKTSPAFPTCAEAQRLTACSEVELIHAGHEAWTRNFDASQRIVDGVKKGMPGIAAALVACKVPEPLVVRVPEKMTLQGDATFRFNRGDLAGMLPAGQAKLERLAGDLKKVDDVTAIRIQGYTDRLGSDSYNRSLSRKRAETVMGYLQSRGITIPMSADGYGKDRPIVQCNDRNREALIECLEPNRRVELDFERRGHAATSASRSSAQTSPQ